MGGHMKNITACPSCGGAKIKKVRRRWSGEYKGRVYAVENLEFYECPDCEERVCDPEAMRAIEANSPAFAKSVATGSA
jgi:YgiT-type zinc finger domain-containing protein